MIKTIVNNILGNKALKKSTRAIKSEKWEEALLSAEKVCKLCPQNTSGHLHKGVALWKLGNINEAIKCFDFVISRYMMFKEETLYLEGDSEEELRFNFISALNNKGSILSQLGRHKEARDLQMMVLKLDPDRESAIKNLKLSLDRDKNVKGGYIEEIGNEVGGEVAKKVILEEIKSHNKALKINPKDMVALIDKGSALAEIEEFKKSIQSYDKALKIQPKNIFALINKGSTFARMGNYDETIKLFDKVIKIDPKNKKVKGLRKLALKYKNEEIKKNEEDKSLNTSLTS